MSLVSCKSSEFSFAKVCIAGPSGPWADLSKDLLEFLWEFAGAMLKPKLEVRKEERVQAWGELGKIMRVVRRAMSVQFVRCQSLCL